MDEENKKFYIVTADSEYDYEERVILYEGPDLELACRAYSSTHLENEKMFTEI